jgi:branched-chain amino acid transport system ATP-binding protein
MLEVRNLHCGYGRLEVIRGVSLHVGEGEIVGLIGSNGAGKSTLLRALVGLLPTWRGETRVQGRRMTGLPAWRGISNAMVLVPEGRQLFAGMTVLENLVVGGYHNPDRQMALEDVLALFPQLRERTGQLAGTLSGGEQQMLAIGRALVARPRLLLLDEPSMGLAPLLVREVLATVRTLKAQGVTVLLVEQNAVAALEIADRAYVLETGEIMLEGEARDLLNNPEVKRAYLGRGYKEVWE